MESVVKGLKSKIVVGAAGRGRDLAAAGVRVGLMVILLSAVAWAQDDPGVRVDGEARPAAASYPGTTTPAAKPVQAAAAEGTGPRLVNNVFFETDIKQVLADIASQTGTVIIPDETVQGFVTIEFRDMPLDRALRLVMLPGGFLSEEVEPGVFLITSPDPSGPNFQRLAQTAIVDLDYIICDDVKAQLPEMFSRFVKYDTNGTRVVITAPQALLDQAVAQIRQLDTAPLQLMIEALVVESSGASKDEFAIGAQDKYWGVDTAIGLLTHVGNASQILYRVLSLVTKDQASIKAMPRVIALEGRKSSFRVSVEQYFSLVSGRLGFEYVRLEAIEAAIGLTITPQVALADQMITCTIEPEVGDVTGTGPENLPIITKRTASTTVRVKDGEVIAIGGLLQEAKREIRRKIPILGDLPLIGGLFRSKDDTTDQREVTIFIVPHILDASGRFEGPLLPERLRAEGIVPPEPTAAVPVTPPQAADPSLRR